MTGAKLGTRPLAVSCLLVADLRQLCRSARYLDYLNKVARENPSLKTEDLPDQKRAP